MMNPSNTQVIYGNTPSKSNCYVVGKHGMYKSTALKKYEDAFYIQCGKYRDKKITGYFEFYMDVYYPTQKSDLDNSLKVVLDCLQKVKAIPNDNKCTLLHIRKFLDKVNPRIEFEIKPIQ